MRIELTNDERGVMVRAIDTALVEWRREAAVHIDSDERVIYLRDTYRAEELRLRILKGDDDVAR